MLKIPTVSIYRNPFITYPDIPPFNADENYPEYIFKDTSLIDSKNQIYRAVRESFFLLGLDSVSYNSSLWNPFGFLIKPGDTVLIKPNAVMHLNMKPDESVFACITNGSLVRAVIDYVYIALKGKGKIIIADAPLAHSDFNEWLKITGIECIVNLYKKQKNFNIQLYDLRNLYVPWNFKYQYSPSDVRNRKIRDPYGYVEVDLGSLSEFTDFTENDIQRLYGSDYQRRHTVKNHLNGHHKYYVAKTVLNSDVFISVPKLKVHSKVGVTLNLKGMVGTQGDKNYIPHHRIGHPGQGGDEYPDLGILQNILNQYRMWLITHLLAHENKVTDKIYRLLVPIQHIGQHITDRIGRRKYGDKYLGNIIGGSWYGNDTAWRMTLDLTRIVLYSNKNGDICDLPQRKFFSVVDGIIGGEEEGPLAPTAKVCGVILAGFNPLAVDIVSSRLMGFDPLKIPMLKNGLKKSWLKLWKQDISDIHIISNIQKYCSMMSDTEDSFLAFQPSKGWQNHIEINKSYN